MSATIGGAIKAYLEGQGLNIQVFRDTPPKLAKPKRPYCTVLEDIVPLVMDPLEDGGPANGGIATGRQTVQLDLWQDWRDDGDKTLESPTLADAITRAIHGARLPTAPSLVYAVLQIGRVRIVERENRIVHHAYTLTVRRVI